MPKPVKWPEEIGTTPGEIVRMLFKQMVRRRTIPFPLQAETPEDEIFTSAERRNKLADEF
ncbi:MAG: type II toxin-antitoxin system RelB/DinJ family antitoxin [Limisphaerales bacterium]